jgi:hypothetical protein
VELRGPVSGTGVIAAPYISAMRFAGTHPFAGVLEGEVILEDASLPNASIRPTNLGMPGSGSLQGQGTIGGAVVTPRVAPSGLFNGLPVFGQTGMLNVGSLRFESSPMMGSSFSVQINGSTPGTGFSQVNSAGPVEIAANTFLGVNLSPSFVPTSGETYAIVTVGGSAPAIGSFMGMPEGTVLTLLSVYQFKLSYVGGDGNDIVLVALNGRNPTNTTLVSSVNPSAPGQAVTFTATVQGTGPLPIGTITFRNGGIVLGTVPLAAGSASITTAALSGGSHDIRAEYSGDAQNGGSHSPVLRQTVSVQGSTPTGGTVDVEVSTTLPGGSTATVDMLFDNVVSSGVTTVAASTGGPTPPDGFQLGNPPLYFDVSTTATFSGNVTLCFGWTEGQFANEAAIGLWHYEGGAWVNVTTLLDTAGNTVCGRATSLSPFALMERRFAFGGFLAPVSNAPLFNAVRAGASVPLKFSLGAFHGLDVFAAGYPRSGVVACGASAAAEPIDGAETPGNSALAYDAATGVYSYVWKTEKAWAGSCRQLMVRFSDGTEARANFELR